MTSGSEERIASIEEIIKSASLGPPNSAEKAAGSIRDAGAGVCAVGSAAVAAEFSTLHFRREDMLGSMIVFVGIWWDWEVVVVVVVLALVLIWVCKWNCT